MPFYRDRAYPHLVNMLGDPEPIQAVRRRIIPLAQGDVLEIGAGSGANFLHYDPGKVRTLYALEPNAGMRRLAERQGRRTGMAIEYLDALDPTLRPTVLANVDALYVFATSAEDARALVHELDDAVEIADIINQDDFTCYAKLALDGRRLRAIQYWPSRSAAARGRATAGRCRRSRTTSPRRRGAISRPPGRGGARRSRRCSSRDPVG